MAGLQYYFFPTDFFYPRAPSPSPADGSAATKAVLPVKALKGLDGGDDFVGQKNPPPQPSSAPASASAASPSSLVLSRSTIERQLRRGQPIIASDTPKQA
ncbi:hypothetical protein ACJRO7_007488 [Eucalyptus globulus]|uniref:Uncharacterized protein n=1 Tax=Eucalyptus globulus TaxID=34317 RepID=A0ABD3ILB4_EUCGL